MLSGFGFERSAESIKIVLNDLAVFRNRVDNFSCAAVDAAKVSQRSKVNRAEHDLLNFKRELVKDAKVVSRCALLAGVVERKVSP